MINQTWPPPQSGRPDPKRQLQGARNRSAGLYFEQMLDWTCEFYLNTGVAKVKKTPEPVKVLSRIDRQGRFTACFEAKAEPDYKGAIAGGTTVVFDAKHTDTDRILHNRLSAEQAKALREYHAMGAAAFVVVSMGFQNFYRVPWILWDNMRQTYGRAYMLEKDLAPHKVPASGRHVFFLEGICIKQPHEERSGQ